MRQGMLSQRKYKGTAKVLIGKRQKKRTAEAMRVRLFSISEMDAVFFRSRPDGNGAFSVRV